MLEIVLSGHANYAPEAAAALTAAGFAVLCTGEDHGLPATASGAPPADGTHTLITVHGHDLDAAVSAVSKYGWVLRAHRHAAQPAAPPDLPKLPDDHPLVLKARLDALESRLA